MKTPFTIADLASIDWASPEARRLTLHDLHTWDQSGPDHRVLQPVADEVAWEETELDLNRTVL